MSSFIIQGNASLSGDIVPQGAKNEALQVLCAVLLTPEKVRINNLPDIRDVKRLIEILMALGVDVTPIDRNTYTFLLIYTMEYCTEVNRNVQQLCMSV